jgi:O-antigen/teichoic acid export membrane protein
VFKGVTSVGNVALSVLLIWWIGAVGAAVATVVMQAFYATLCLYVVHTEIGLRPRHLCYRVGQVVCITGVMSAVVFSLLRYVDGLLTIGAVILCGAGVWALLARTGGLLDVDALTEGGPSGQQSD